jgi:uncharacterized membrane protein
MENYKTKNMKTLNRIIAPLAFMAFLFVFYYDSGTTLNMLSFQVAVLFCVLCIVLLLDEKKILGSKAGRWTLLGLSAVFFILFLLWKVDFALSGAMFFATLWFIQVFRKYDTQGEGSPFRLRRNKPFK